MANGRVISFPETFARRRPRPRTWAETRELLERLMTCGTDDDLAEADPDWFRPPTDDVCGTDWYDQFGDATFLKAARRELRDMVVELRQVSRAPAARALNAAAWFEDWVELPQPALGGRAPSEVLCTPAGLEAAKVVLRALRSRACE
jgi:hypothetical protein